MKEAKVSANSLKDRCKQWTVLHHCYMNCYYHLKRSMCFPFTYKKQSQVPVCFLVFPRWMPAHWGAHKKTPHWKADSILISPDCRMHIPGLGMIKKGNYKLVCLFLLPKVNSFYGSSASKSQLLSKHTIDNLPLLRYCFILKWQDGPVTSRKEVQLTEAL